MRRLIIIGLDVFLEKRKTRLHVGVLHKKDGKFIFAYDRGYFKAKHVFPLGPEFPLTQQKFESTRLFPSFEDRIPSLQNPAYPEYCKMMGIDPNENDQIILLSTIGRKGPSSFVFSPIFDRAISAQDVIKFRQSLGLTTREFASVFELSQGSLNALETGRASGVEILKRLEVILNFPAVALDFLLVNQGTLIYDRWIKAVNVLTLKQNKEKDL